MPDKYQIILKEFEPLFNDYIEIYKEVKLKPETLRKIINFIRGTADPYNEAEYSQVPKHFLALSEMFLFFESDEYPH